MTSRWLALLFVGGSIAAGCATPPPVMMPDASDQDATPTMDAALDARGRLDAGVCVDNDNDGHPSAACGGDDCDDNNPRVNPGIREFCDNRGVDEDCDPCTVAEVTPTGFGGDGDRDEDRFVSTGCFNRLAAGASMPVCSAAQLDAGADASASVGYVTVSATEVRGTDCADDPAAGGGSRFPGALEVCNGVDDNCVNATMDEMRVPYYRDSDGDGFGDRSAMGANLVMACAPPFGFSRLGTDCDDANAMINPAAREVCDALGRIDENCNGTIDEGCGCPRVGETRACCSSRGVETCTATGMGSVWGSCTADIRSETCNSVDDDCDGTADEGLTILCYPDRDDDGFAAMGARLEPVCPDSGRMRVGNCPARYTNVEPTDATNTDCNDALSTRFPTRPEFCNGVDDDCNDSTADGTGDLIVGTSCAAMAGVGRCGTGSNACVSGAIQCRANTAIQELCNGIDDDCDSLTDEGLCVDSATNATGTGMCVSAGECSMGRCFEGRANCDANNRNGCETDILTDPNQCGACGMRCLSGSCDHGICVGAAILAVDIGTMNACVVLSSGQVACWGSNLNGQLGTGNTIPSSRFEWVSSLSDAISVSVGNGFSCAVRRTGQVVCWGSNTAGRLGDGTITPRAAPVAVAGLSNAVEVSAGDSFACARLATGAVSCWGANNSAQLGDGTSVATLGLVAVAGLLDAVEIAAALNHACARRANGQVVCWGTGFLGDGRAALASGPVTVSGLSDAVEISAGAQHTCARRATGAIVCWGANTNGQLGNGTTATAMVPVTVASLTDAIGITTGANHSCARRNGGWISCWGADSSGQLGDGASADRTAPVAIPMSPVRRLTAGSNSTCSIDVNGVVRCWGVNSLGQLGDGTTSSPRRRPIEVFGQTTATAVELGATHSCARLANGMVSCWGSNSLGQLGPTMRANVPVTRVTFVPETASLSSGTMHTCLVSITGIVSCAGQNSAGQLGDGTTLSHSSYAPVADLLDVAEVAAGTQHTCARQTTGAVYCWGSNSAGQLGNGAVASSSTPVAVSTIRNAVQISVGGAHSCAVLATGELRCWGEGSSGQLGTGSTMPSRVPVPVMGVSEVVQVAAGDSHTCARRGNGAVLCWGNNSFSETGDGTTINRTTPYLLTLAGPALSVAAGDDHTCVRLAAGTMQCVGRGGDGQIGDGMMGGRHPTLGAVTGVSNAAQFDSAGAHNCVVRSTGVVSCWGLNSSGQLGDSSTTTRFVPVDVDGL